MKIGIASALGGLGSCALLAHSIKRTIDSNSFAATPDRCAGAVECGSPDPDGIVVEYVGAALLGLTSLFGAGAAWMFRQHDGS